MQAERVRVVVMYKAMASTCARAAVLVVEMLSITFIKIALFYCTNIVGYLSGVCNGVVGVGLSCENGGLWGIVKVARAFVDSFSVKAKSLSLHGTDARCCCRVRKACSRRKNG